MPLSKRNLKARYQAAPTSTPSTTSSGMEWRWRGTAAERSRRRIRGILGPRLADRGNNFDRVDAIEHWAHGDRQVRARRLVGAGQLPRGRVLAHRGLAVDGGAV